MITILCLRSIGWHTYVNLGVVSLREGRHNKKINKHGWYVVYVLLFLIKKNTLNKKYKARSDAWALFYKFLFEF